MRQALAGIRVVDLTQVLAGPTSARILAEYGAEVIKINSAQDRQLGMHFYTNSGKRTLLLNVKTPEGMRILWQLVEQADVFVQNFTGASRNAWASARRTFGNTIPRSSIPL